MFAQLIYCNLVKQHGRELDVFEGFKQGGETPRCCTCYDMTSLSGLGSVPDEKDLNYQEAMVKRRFCFSFLCARGILLNIVRAAPNEFLPIIRLQQGIIGLSVLDS